MSSLAVGPKVGGRVGRRRELPARPPDSACRRPRPCRPGRDTRSACAASSGSAAGRPAERSGRRWWRDARRRRSRRSPRRRTAAACVRSLSAVRWGASTACPDGSASNPASTLRVSVQACRPCARNGLSRGWSKTAGSRPSARHTAASSNGLVPDGDHDAGRTTRHGPDAVREFGGAERGRGGRREPAHRGSSSSPSVTRSPTGSCTPQQPKLRNRRRTRTTSAITPGAAAGRAARRVRRRPAARAASASEAPSTIASTAISRLRNPCRRGRSGSGPGSAQAWCRPAVALNGRSASISTPSWRASWALGGVSAGSGPPVRILPNKPAASTSSTARSHPGVNGNSTKTVIVLAQVGGGGHHPHGVADEVVQIAQRRFAPRRS